MAASIHRTMAAIFNQKLMFHTFLLLTMYIYQAQTAKLSDPKILLPYHSSVITNFTLSINLTKEEARSFNCYTWSVVGGVQIVYCFPRELLSTEYSFSKRN